MNAPLPEPLARVEASTLPPWWLHEADCVWLVEEGAVDIFATGIDADGRPSGPRRALYRVFPQMAMMRVDRDIGAAGEALLAMPVPHSRIRAFPIAQLRRLATTGQAHDFIAELITSWVGVITRGLPLPPRDYYALRMDEVNEVRQGEAFCAIESTRWVRCRGAPAAFMGERELEIPADAAPVPLRRDVWCRAVDDLQIEIFEEAALIAAGDIWAGVALYQRLAIRHALVALDRAGTEEAARLQVKARQSSRVMHDALTRFVRVVEGTGDLPPELPDEPLLAACELVGQRIGVAFQPPPRRSQPPVGIERLHEIADASGVRTRAVALKDEWWRDDNGPLLAFHADTNAPYALLPVKDHRYDLHDPATGTVERVTSERAQRLAPFATQFYRPFPPKAIGLYDLLKFALRGQRRDVTTLLGLGLLGGIIGMAIPIATGRMVDTVIPSAQANDALALMLGLIAAIFAAELFQVVRAVAVLRVESKMDGAVQSAVWDRVLALPVPFFRGYSAGDLANRINGINVIRHALSGSTVSTLLAGVFALLNFLLLFYYSTVLAVLAAVLTAIAIGVSVSTGLLKLRYERQLADLAGKVSGTVFQYLVGIVKLRVSASENRAFANWAREFTKLRSLAFRAQNIGVSERTFFAGYTIIINALVFAVIGAFVLRSGGLDMSTGDFVAFSAAFGGFLAALMGTSATILGLLNLVPIYTRAKPILSSLPEVDASKKHPGDLQGGIEVVKVGFSYTPDQEILKDTSFSVRAGGFIALVGPSGSGKSTLFRLMLGFEKPHRGSIYYDNQDLADLDVRAVRRQLGVVLQGGQLMTGDIFTNIVGTSSLTLDDAWEAARMVGLEDEITKMPMGMHTVISEGSSTLSGGQRQRILIARAIAHRPRILFFDEATSALDNRTQAIVSHSLEQLKATRIVIAHRLSTVINADRIIVLQDGAIVQTGNYKALIAQPGPFADLARRQIA